MLWLRDWEFCRRYGCRDGDSTFRLQDSFSVRQRLQQFKTDTHKMATMRTLLSQEGNASDLSRISDDVVIQQVAELLVSGRLHIHIQPAPSLVSGGQSSDSTSSTSGGTSETLAPSPVSERRQREKVVRSPKTEVDADPATFSSAVQVAAQAATLKIAAKDGSLACEICQ